MMLEYVIAVLHFTPTSGKNFLIDGPPCRRIFLRRGVIELLAIFGPPIDTGPFISLGQ